jgi:hypothetical protein
MRERPVVGGVVLVVLLALGALVVWRIVGRNDMVEVGPAPDMLSTTAPIPSIPPLDTAGSRDGVPSADQIALSAPGTVPAGPPVPDDRPVVDASDMVGEVILDTPDTVYDFGGVDAARDITIGASNVEARNIRGTGARRIGQRDGRDYVDSGFRDFEFTYLQTQNGGGGRIIRPYFVDGTDVNPDGYSGEGSPAHIYAYEGDVVAPLIDGVIVRGWDLPDGSEAHNDGIHITGIDGGRVFDPVIRNSNVLSGAAIGLLMRNVYGVVTIEGSSFEARYGALHAVLGDGEDTEALVGILWRDNTLVGGATASFVAGYELDPRSEVGSDAVVVQSR